MHFASRSFIVLVVVSAIVANVAANKNGLFGDAATRVTLIRRENAANTSDGNPEVSSHQPAYEDEHARSHAQRTNHEIHEQIQRQARWAERLERHEVQSLSAWNGPAWAGAVSDENGPHCADWPKPPFGDTRYNCYSYAVGDVEAKKKNNAACQAVPGKSSGVAYANDGGAAGLINSVQADCDQAFGAVVWREGDVVPEDLGEGPLVAAFATNGGFHFTKLPRKGGGWQWKNGNMHGVQSTLGINNQCNKIADLDIFKIDANKAGNTISWWNYKPMTLKAIFRLTGKCTTAC